MNHSFDIEHATLYGIPEAVIIHNFQFWIVRNRANGTHQHDGRTWLYNSVKALGVLFPYMTGDKIRRALESLEKQNVLVTGFYGERPGDRTKWFAFADESKFLPPPDHLAKTPNGGGKGGKDHLAKTPNGLAKTPNAFGENAKSSKQTDVNTDVTSDNTSTAPTSDELFEQAWLAYPKRKGASKKECLKQWNARLKSGADPLKIIEGIKAYAACKAAEGTEERFLKSAETFFGPGEHYNTDWTPCVPAAAPAPAPVPTRPQKFDPTAYVNSGAAYANQQPAPAAAYPNDPYTIDGEFVERPA